MSTILKFFLVALPLVFVFSLSNAQLDLEHPPELSERSVVSLITGAPGKELYASFGHSAIRIYDPVVGFDIVYNYGTFDFNAPGFYSNYVQGNPLYKLSVYSFRYMIQDYRHDNRSLFEQQLDLTLEERQQVFDYLNNNFMPENRNYLYESFMNNCSTKIRDVFEIILGSKLKFKDDYIVEHVSFRQLIDHYLELSVWGDFGINLALGVPIDRIASSREYMFLPYEMMRAFGTAYLVGQDMQYPFVRTTNVIYQQVDQQEKGLIFTPKSILWALFIIIAILSFFQYRTGMNLKWLDTTLFLILGLTGLLIAYMWFGTDRATTKWNLNILWASPVYIIFPFILIRRRLPDWLKYLVLVLLVLTVTVLAGWFLLPQQFHSAILPLCLVIILRLLFILNNIKRSINNKLI